MARAPHFESYNHFIVDELAADHMFSTPFRRLPGPKLIVEIPT